MKRIVTLMLAAMLVLGSVAGASAADIKVKGQWDFAFQWLDNTNFRDGDDSATDAGEDDFDARQRFRTQIDIIASENLRGVVFFEIGETVWGRAGDNNRDGGALGADGLSVEVKRSYIDWTVPNTDLMVRMGIQGLALPGVVAGSPVLDDDVAALTLSYKFNDMVSATAFWARPFESNDTESNGHNSYDEMDLFGVLLPLSFDGVKVTPWAMYGSIGEDVSTAGSVSTQGAHGLRPIGAPSSGKLFGKDTTMWWAGSSFEVSMFSPLSFKLDAMYGNLEGDEIGTLDMDRSGWLVIGAVDYKMDMMTPGLFAWYASGDDDDRDNGSERMPYIQPDFGPTSFGFDKVGAPIGNDSNVSVSGTGLWGVGVQLANISFVENLKHTLRVVYMEGTNDKDMANVASFNVSGNGIYLTEKDSAWEVNLDHFYKIYENLDLIVEMGYIKVDLSDEWTNDQTSDAWKLGFNLKYSF
ncbi:outer membrane homotrimeric porin [Nitratidesulfovibrio sp. SRB-5]|uniref:outer membrane homotrimeric porin n=1 Tax=Nitratidesulfovibrio sp. SRB-5 TaxID=2872636 RepID=UPI00102668DE|nr:outer membrane homotrimeric porin [Nitratidesulfovibrio sp. SRB-5]MBZ2171019.1 outer membrane homotrimeric porin [Nitratidesulfovibrio sp. SRB-5]RXF77035.1 porin [Desulfovibrio sp. DS-1]